LQPTLDAVTAKYFGEADAGLLGAAHELQSQTWTPPVSIISGDVGVRLLALGRRIYCLEPKDALNGSAVRSWLASLAHAPDSPMTVRSMLDAATRLRLAGIDLGLHEIVGGNQADAQLRTKSETITVAVTASRLASEHASSTQAVGWGFFVGRELLGSFVWEASSKITDDGAVQGDRVITFQKADTIPAYVAEGIRESVESILRTRLYPPHHVARAWFDAKFVDNGLDPLQAWVDVSEPFDFELNTFEAVLRALEDCKSRWRQFDWPEASAFAYDIMHRVCPGETVVMKLAPDKRDT
jgi:hypothetical protein